MDLRIAHATDIGRNPHRDMNEDAVLADALPLVAVADGMGGHEAGEVASNLAVDTLRTWKDRLEAKTDVETADVLREAFVDVNRTVYEKGSSDESLAGMGTTLTAGWFGDDAITFAHVGDSRLYLLRGNNLRQLTEDQTVAQELVRRGRIRSEELESSPQRHYLLQAIGAEGDLEIPTSTVKLRPGDRVIFATDGVYGMLTEPADIKQILLDHPDPQDACNALVAAANAAGGHDNISVVIVDVVGDPSELTDDADEIIEHHEVATAPPPMEEPPRSSRRRWIVLGGAVVLLIVMAVVFVLRPATSRLLVASRGDDVVVVDGHAGAGPDEPAQGDVVHTFEEYTVDEFSTTVQREFVPGIPVDSLAHANEVVRNLRKLTPAELPTAKPTKEPSPSPDESPPGTPKGTKAP